MFFILKYELRPEQFSGHRSYFRRNFHMLLKVDMNWGKSFPISEKIFICC